MILQDVVQFDNAFGKPIQVRAIETETQLYISLRKCKSFSKQINLANKHQQQAIPSESPVTKEENGCVCKVHGGPDKESSATNSKLNRTRDQESLNLLRYSRRTLFLLFITASVVILLLTQALFQIFVCLGPGTILLCLLAAALAVQYFRSDHLLIEESLVVFKNSGASSWGKEGPLLQNTCMKDSVSADGYLLYLKKYRLWGTQTQALFMKNLKICEIVRKNKIRYSLVVQSNCLNSVTSMECNKQADFATASDAMQNRKNKPLTETTTSDGSDSPQPDLVDETVIFEKTSPKLECLEYVVSRIKAFSK